MTILEQLAQKGQSIWLDFIQRKLIVSGELAKMINGGLRGMTSNPAIFEKAISAGTDYDDFLAKLNEQQVLAPVDLYEALAIRDVQDAADIFYKTYKQTKYLDGYVSLEVSPHLALNPEGTLAEARRLWARVNRPNVLIKVPGTPVCIPVIEQLISEGININVTLLFSQELYKQAAGAYFKGLERRAQNKLPIDAIASVASFFVSRIDSAVDKVAPKELQGKVAIANAKQAYRSYGQLYSSDRWKKLESNGAQPQRLLWASTSVKNPEYRDVLYIEELIGPHTVNTIPPNTYDAFVDHGEVKDSLRSNLEEADRVMADLKKAGVNFEEISNQLLVDGIRLFVDPFQKMLNAIQSKHPSKAAKVPSLWGEQKSNHWLGWLDVFVDKGAPDPFLYDTKSISSVALLGMGGSSLAPDVIDRIMGPFDNFHMLDSTDPDQIAELESKIDVEKTLFIVSSKSGSTLEPNIFYDYFASKANNNKHFIAVTDPGSSLEKLAHTKNFASVYYGLPSIGGRYSALSNFGLVPGMLMGAPISKLIEHAQAMRELCQNEDLLENPGARLGYSLGQLALKGRDKVTFIGSKELTALGDWIEQLIAESTGKEGKGLVPIANEDLGAPGVYGDDRVFVYAHLTGDQKLESKLEALERAGHPVIRLEVPSVDYLGAEFFRWEIATAHAGRIIGIDAFDQPDVEAAKVEARKLMADYQKLPKPPFSSGKAKELLDKLISEIKAGDYFAIQAFLPRNAKNQDFLQKLRLKIRDKHKVATTLGFGPRFLHSTGQLHKGGPSTGVFLQVVSSTEKDIKVPSEGYSFDQVKHAQALGDFNVLESRKRRVISVSWEDLCKLV